MFVLDESYGTFTMVEADMIGVVCLGNFLLSHSENN